jgi:hypothetical protein
MNPIKPPGEGGDHIRLESVERRAPDCELIRCSGNGVRTQTKRLLGGNRESRIRSRERRVDPLESTRQTPETE